MCRSRLRANASRCAGAAHPHDRLPPQRRIGATGAADLVGEAEREAVPREERLRFNLAALRRTRRRASEAARARMPGRSRVSRRRRRASGGLSMGAGAVKRLRLCTKGVLGPNPFHSTLQYLCLLHM